MGNNYDIILIGLVAVFLILRLRSVLGKRTGNERPPARDPFTPPAAADRHAARRRCAGQPGQRQRRAAADGQCAGAAAVAARPADRAASAPRSCRPPPPASPPFAPPIPASSRSASPPARAPPSPPSSRPSPRATPRPLRPLLDGPTFASFEGGDPRPRRAQGEGRDDADRLRGLRRRRRRAAGQRTPASPSASSASRSTCCAMPTARSSMAIPTRCRRSIDLWTFRRDTKSSDPNWLLIKTESEG